METNDQEVRWAQQLYQNTAAGQVSTPQTHSDCIRQS